ncbi:putative membrane protein YphA (DoxX/SURF4 family) [Dysgonomonas hofstadii]|uniref:Putative membrane protein YphA (DoxX/SURF4 family) n=1 Tax=Dysgonomonas hofstadii TaxID=637886 RepID=A0A840CRQ4_9BACT|nr:BT_3928 family protein [Dysgonomonas hofstadii]MBB4037731.1 putative membrane protein YphA (DoxX/SURF4 family) [Dysgonomonas hofstadii]
MIKKNFIIKVLVEISRIILGVTFIFSGFVKAVDPFGTAYKIEDYLAAFDFSSLSFLALPASALLCIVEFAMGACMLFGLYRKWNSRLMLLVMGFMTLLTLYLAIADPVDDCGCFGDALVITNWQTFYKNIVLLICSVITFIYHERISNLFSGKTYWLAFLYIFIFIGLFTFRNYLLDPLFDFRPYKVGANLPELMDVDEGKGRLEESFLVYTKDGVEKEFTEENYPWEDSTWVFVRMETKVIDEGESSPIKDFVINKLDFNPQKTELLDQYDITREVLSDSNYVFLMISPLLSEMSVSYLSSFEDIENYATDNGYKFYCLTASPTGEIMSWANENVINFDFCTMDERTLKTIIRSNPGLLLLKNGIVINKWADIAVPSESDLVKPLNDLPEYTSIDAEYENKKNMFMVCTFFLIPLLALKGFDFLVYRRRRVEEAKSVEKEEP